MIVYLDEAGDLGWSFDKPYRRGGSSRYLVIAAVVADSNTKQFPKRVIKRLYDKHGWDPQTEMKWRDIDPPARLDFCSKACELARCHPEVTFHAIVVRKDRVEPHIQRDPNKLYNYMIKRLLLDEMAKREAVNLLPDQRTMKVASGNSLHDYLQSELWFERKTKTILTTLPGDRRRCPGTAQPPAT